MTPRPCTTDPAVAAVERAAAVYRDAWGAWMVSHHRGAPPGRIADGLPGLASRLVQARRDLAAALRGIPDRVTARDAAALRCLRSAVEDLDAWAPALDGWAGSADGVGSADDAPAPAEEAEPATEPVEVAALRRAVFDAWGETMAAIDDRGESIDRLTATARLARLEDPAERRRLFLAMEPGWRCVDGDGGAGSPYRRLVESSAARWSREGSPIDRNAAALGLEPAAVDATLRALVRRFREVAMPGGLMEPWDYRYHLGALARRVDPVLGVERLRPINDAHLRAIGADPERLRISYDIFPRPRRPVIPTAFTTTRGVARQDARGRWRAARPWVFATYAEGGIGNLEELLHESGHAIHYAAIRARPTEFEPPGDHVAWVEAIADVVGWTTHEPAFIARHLGLSASSRESVLARYGNVALDACWTLFEIELHRSPSRRPNEVWAEIMERDLGVAGHPEWSWWAMRGQLIDGPGYLANYALGAIVVAAVRARLRELRGDWSEGDPGWYPFVAERLLRFGGSRAPAQLLDVFLGGPPDPGALLADLERGA
jgi:hypothetical protein